ncbi:cytochrome P450 CYP12A2-like [Anticarsia gemmatalis]|uniref:cytochrome P450 CYP12A2-like n=1 Tax=Anticarsia gemmatalis TaxID=129554 RepID=UPI003F76E043
MLAPKLIILSRAKIFQNSIRFSSVASPTVSVSKPEYVKPLRKIPGPSTLPVIGQLRHFLPGGSLYQVKSLWEELFKSYGPIVQLNVLFLPRRIILYDPESIAQIVRSENEYPVRPGLSVMKYYRTERKEKTKDDKPNLLGVLLEEGERWKQSRTVLNPIMLKPDIPSKYVKSLNDVAQDMVTRLKFLRDENNMIPNFEHETKLWGLESNAAVAIGKRLRCFSVNELDCADPVITELIKETVAILELTDELERKPSLWKYFPTKDFRKFMHAADRTNEITKNIIVKVKEELKTNKISEEEKGILEKLLETDDEFAVVSTVDNLLAGVDTQSASINAFLYLMAMNPDKQDKLRKKLNTNQYKPYFRACLKESMRLIPAVPILGRITSKDYDILGYRIPKGTEVIMCQKVLAVSEKHFVRAKEFIPERWLVDRDHPLHYKNAHPFAYLPFGFGIRSCIGLRVSKFQLEIFLTHLIENFIFEWKGPPAEIKESTLNFITSHNFVLKDVEEKK